jgi:hypothetical protein
MQCPATGGGILPGEYQSWKFTDNAGNDNLEFRNTATSGVAGATRKATDLIHDGFRGYRFGSSGGSPSNPGVEFILGGSQSWFNREYWQADGVNSGSHYIEFFDNFTFAPATRGGSLGFTWFVPGSGDGFMQLRAETVP